MLALFFPWTMIAKQAREIAMLKNEIVRLQGLIRPFDGDGDGKPGGSGRK